MAVPEGEVNLQVLASRSGIPVKGSHNALTDAYITAQLLQRQLRALPALGVRTWAICCASAGREHPAGPPHPRRGGECRI